MTGAKLITAFAFNALNRGAEVYQNIHWLNRGSIASIGGGTFGGIDGGLAAFSGKTEFPARFFGSTLLFAVLKSGSTFGVLFTSSPLSGTLLLDTVDGIVDISSINFDGSDS